MGTLLFILLFAVAYRDLAMPRISRRALLPALMINASIVGVAAVGLPQYQSSPPRTRSSS